jgi:hypothetical protein
MPKHLDTRSQHARDWHKIYALPTDFQPEALRTFMKNFMGSNSFLHSLQVTKLKLALKGMRLGIIIIMNQK